MARHAKNALETRNRTSRTLQEEHNEALIWFYSMRAGRHTLRLFIELNDIAHNFHDRFLIPTK